MGLITLIKRGRIAGPAAFGGSGAFALVLPVGRLPTGVSLNSALGGGSAMLRRRAWRSTNWRATISSIELDALFTSMPVSCLSRAMASGLDMPRSSATL